MANQKYTTAEAAGILGVTVATFRKRARIAGVKAVGSLETTKRGRPAQLWAASSVTKLKA